MKVKARLPFYSFSIRLASHSLFPLKDNIALKKEQIFGKSVKNSLRNTCAPISLDDQKTALKEDCL